MRKGSLSVLILAAALLGGCGDDDGTSLPDTDGGMELPDGSTGGGDDDGGTTGSDGGGSSGSGICASPRSFTLSTGSATTVTGNTSEAGGSLEMAECGSSSQTAPQDVIAVTLPGSPDEIYAVTIDLAQSGTAIEFDTVVQVRETCDSEVNEVCIDDGASGSGDYRSVGTFAAPGGSTRFLVITGYPWGEVVAEGPYEARIEVSGPLSPPQLTGGTVVNVEGVEQHFTLMGTDPDGDVLGFELTFLDAGGAPIGIDTDGDPATPAVSTFLFRLDDTEGLTSFTGTAIIGSEGVTEIERATHARVALVDAADLRSATMDLPVTPGFFAGRGESCDTTHVCSDILSCVDGTCELPEAVASACDMAPSLTLSTAAQSTTVTIPGGDGYLFASCTYDPSWGPATLGNEAYVRVNGAPGYDIVISTAGPTTGETDTVLYALTSCGESSTEVACNDDGSETSYASILEILDSEDITYTIVVETFEGSATDIEVDFIARLRPVLASGEACDPSGVENRCGSGACPTSGDAICP